MSFRSRRHCTLIPDSFMQHQTLTRSVDANLDAHPALHGLAHPPRHKVELALRPRRPARVHIIRCVPAPDAIQMLMTIHPRCYAVGGTVATIGVSHYQEFVKFKLVEAPLTVWLTSTAFADLFITAFLVNFLVCSCSDLRVQQPRLITVCSGSTKRGSRRRRTR